MSKKIVKGDVYRKYVFDELSRKINGKYEDPKDREQKFKELEHYVDSLNDHKAKKLCCHLSHLRRNPVYSFVKRGPEKWLVEDVKISKIYMISINHKVNSYLRDNFFSLKESSKDKRVRKHKEFGKKGDIHPRCLTLLAHRVDGYRFKLIDGNHRAIKLARDGEKKLRLIYY